MYLNNIPKKLRSSNNKGLTLVEILIVIAIIATLATVAIGNLGGIFSGQQGKIASIFVKQTAKLVLTNYKLDVGSYPCLLYTSPSPRDDELSRMPSSA